LFEQTERSDSIDRREPEEQTAGLNTDRVEELTRVGGGLVEGDIGRIDDLRADSHLSGTVTRPDGSRDRILARSNRNASTCISVTQYRRLSTIIRCTTGWSALSVLPQPESSAYRAPPSSKM
jgi:hypothetical protein